MNLLILRVAARELDGRESVVVIEFEQADLSRQARGALSKHWQGGEPAAPWRRSYGGCSTSRTLPFLTAMDSGRRSWTGMRAALTAVYPRYRRCAAWTGAQVPGASMRERCL